VLPTGLWLAHYGLFEAFSFDVLALNLAISKPWYHSFGLLSVAVFMPSLLGMLAWRRSGTAHRRVTKNCFLVVFLALLCGCSGVHRAALGPLQPATADDSARGWICQPGLILWLHGRDLGNRLLITLRYWLIPLSIPRTCLRCSKVAAGLHRANCRKSWNWPGPAPAPAWRFRPCTRYFAGP